MKTSEMIAMLEKDPKLRFTSGGEISTMEAICRSGNIELYYIPAELRYEFRCDRDWQLVREPVTWQEALQAALDGKTIVCKNCAGCGENCGDYKEKQILSIKRNGENDMSICLEQLQGGTWYIED